MRAKLEAMRQAPEAPLTAVAQLKLDRRASVLESNPLAASSAPPASIFACVACAKYFSNEVQLDQHNDASHPLAAEGFRCPECSTMFRVKSQLSAHMYQKHEQFRPMAAAPEKRQRYTCPICFEKFTTEGELSDHTRSHVDTSSLSADSSSGGVFGAPTWYSVASSTAAQAAITASGSVLLTPEYSGGNAELKAVGRITANGTYSSAYNYLPVANCVANPSADEDGVAITAGVGSTINNGHFHGLSLVSQLSAPCWFSGTSSEYTNTVSAERPLPVSLPVTALQDLRVIARIDRIDIDYLAVRVAAELAVTLKSLNITPK
jgi:hypothetical protein